jgi:hypothetical protein
LNWLGLQDAARKRRDASRAPGAWAGCVIRITDEGVFVLSEQEKWIKAKALLREVLDMLDEDSERLDRKRLEQIREFLGYVTRTYPCMIPYMMGLHLTIDGWRKNRDGGGWRLTMRELRYRTEVAGELGSEEEVADGDAPPVVSEAPRLRADMHALLSLMSSSTPVLRRVRCKKATNAYYGFGDASGLGFGATIQIGDEVWYEYGQWSTEVIEDSSSNWREFSNLVQFLEGTIVEHKLSGSEIFIFTDNITAEAAFWKGSSSSPRLFNLILRLRKLEMDRNMIIHVVHVAGKRMIDQGTDGLSRADHTTGAITGRDIHHWVP